VGNLETGWTPYPWHSLEKIPRAAVRATRVLKEALNDPGLLLRFGEAARSLLGDDAVRFVARPIRLASPTVPVFRDGPVCLLANPERTVHALVEVEPELAHRISMTLLSRPPLWVDRTQPTPSLLHAAIGAFVIAAIRKASSDHGLYLDAVGPSARQRFIERIPAVSPVVDMTVAFGDGSFGASIWWQAAQPPTRGLRPFDPRSLGAVPLSMVVVAAVSTATRGELSSLEVGDAWMPAEGWSVRSQDGVLSGDVSLSSPTGTAGLTGSLRPDGGIVLRETAMQPQDGRDRSSTPDPGSSKAGGVPTSEALADVPVVVRVEVGTVTLSAREWAAVQPGDVVTTGHRIAERVTLRVGGVEVARGELVDVEGELGVRIHEVLGSSDGGV